MLKKIAEGHAFACHNAKAILLARSEIHFKKEDINDADAVSAFEKMRNIIGLLQELEFFLDEVQDLELKHKPKWEPDKELQS